MDQCVGVPNERPYEDFSLSQSGRHSTARRLARAIRGELCCAVFLYGIGDRTDEVLKTIAYGKIVYDVIGRPLPSPPEIERTAWKNALERIVDRFGHTALRAAANVA